MKTFASSRVLIMVIGILSGVSFVIVGGSKFLGVSAQTDPVEKQVEQNFLNGRIAFHRGRYGMSTSERVIETSNADGGGGWADVYRESHESSANWLVRRRHQDRLLIWGRNLRR